MHKRYGNFMPLFGYAMQLHGKGEVNTFDDIL